MSQQLNESKRFVLAELLHRKVPKTEIAKRLDVHRSTVHRELNRNTGPLGYIPEEAHGRARMRLMLHGRKPKMDDAKTKEYVCQHLQRRWHGSVTACTSSRWLIWLPAVRVNRDRRERGEK